MDLSLERSMRIRPLSYRVERDRSAWSRAPRRNPGAAARIGGVACGVLGAFGVLPPRALAHGGKNKKLPAQAGSLSGVSIHRKISWILAERDDAQIFAPI